MNAMNIMKYFLMAGIATILLSCNDWLDVKPTSQLDREDLLASESGFAEALTGVYANMTKPELYGRELTWGTLDVLAGVYYGGAMSGGRYVNMYDFRYKRDNSGYSENTAATIDEIWNSMYTQIANINALLDVIDGKKNVFSGDNYSIIKGEAIGLRAFLHFELLRMFGPSHAADGQGETLAIPYVDKLSTSVTPLMSVDSVLNRVITDLKEARQLLENDPMHLNTAPDAVLAPLPDKSYLSNGIPVWHNRRFCFNYYAAVATLARAYLWKDDKPAALAAALEVIADQETRFSWLNDANVTTVGGTRKNQDRTFATEHIFAMNIVDINDYMDGYCYFGESAWAESYLAPNAFLQWGNIFEGSTDFRQLYLKTTVGGNAYSNKYWQTGAVYSFFQERVPLIRISEMYYIAAECEADPATARTYLEAVRSHRGLSSMPLGANIGRSELDAEIKKEYRKEFIGEGQLWYYYKRHDVDFTDGYQQYMHGIGFFTDKNLYVFDRPDDEDGNRQ